MAVKEEEGGEGLVLGGGGEVAFGGEVGNKGLNFFGAHVFGMAFIVEEDVANDPVFVSLFGALGIMFNADGVADLLEEFFALRWAGGRCLLHIDLFSR